MTTPETTTTDGVRLLSHRPSVLYKVEHLATEPPVGDIAVEGIKLAGPGWDDRLKTLLHALSQSERACLFAVRLADERRCRCRPRRCSTARAPTGSPSSSPTA